MQRIAVIDSHTGGEPTRVIVAGGPDLGGGSVTQQRERFQTHHDSFRRAVICEPRGCDVLVGALLRQASELASATGVIFFNNVGYLGMCGHGTIGVAVTLGYLGRIKAGRYIFETPVGHIPIEYDGANTVALENVASHRLAKDVAVEVPGIGKVTGDVAWGGNWFFWFAIMVSRWSWVAWVVSPRSRYASGRLCAKTRLRAPTGRRSTTWNFSVRLSTCATRAEILFLCPGGAYDRSPCGTGTSAKIACLAADGLLKPGEPWRQESILGSVFTASYRTEGNRTIPKISGQAFVTAEATLLVDEADPLAWGCPS